MAESSVITPAADLTRRVDYLAERVDGLTETVGDLRVDVEHIKARLDSMESTMATKEDIAKLETKIIALIAAVREDQAVFRAEMFKRETSLLRWVALFMLAQAGLILSVIKFF